ncbi:hypothetical protein RHM58_32975 [Pseudomonas sp. 10S4]|uniref:hypothetical protein n=1 Tax=Pseudomonas sp. 10S4 TaxID=3048583 RepID=UPI002AC99D5B|nr:hypothetical protein [Pseudomonas sp. 10S4]WPX18453.1 hypothetical protein RHM58_32975 [Pseudomonas sp. 10S4]
MKIDFRILGAVSLFVVLAIGTLYFTRWDGGESVASVAVAEGLQVAVASSGVEFELKDCEVGRFEDPFFFMHIRLIFLRPVLKALLIWISV